MSKILLKKGDKGSLVKEVRKRLGIKEGSLFDDEMKTATMEFQKKKKLEVDGLIGKATFGALGIENPEEYLSTDISNVSDNTKASQNTLGSATQIKTKNIVVNQLMLDKDEYFPMLQNKRWIIIHHTAGNSDPFAVVKNWNNDDRGRIATEYVIGGKSSNGNDINDGVIVKCMQTGSYAYHLGNNGNSKLHPESIGIEICNWGWLTKGGYKVKGKWVAKKESSFYNYVGGEVPVDQVADLGYEFRGFQFWHKYTDKQLEALKALLDKLLVENKGINQKGGLSKWLNTETPAKAFEYKEIAFSGKESGIFTHTNIRTDKFDCYPYQPLVDLLKSY